jgi:hypothetical protein
VTPLDFLLCIMRDGKLDAALRLDAAKAAARYVHPTLAAVQHSGPELGPIQLEARQPSDLELARMIARVLLKVEPAFSEPAQPEP